MDLNITQSVIEACLLSLKIFIIITLLLIVYEFYENSRFYNWTKKLLDRPMQTIGISSNASITMVVGIVLGIAYGAGILLKNVQERKMNSKDIALTSYFLAVCHAVFEDTLLFVAVGANGFIIIGVRILLAVILISILNKYIFRTMAGDSELGR
ncbi:nucleoside recognition domain-containing protein [Flexistipes sp.]|uniref:nucleoside recognition domain-containing protein n=1 Tax=Flexistipes sp. TaxID=3088135 RepID=UPI002E1E0B91|nr:nucleoside recognition domain-containing protein [Flexistipes sp.]